MSEGVLSRAPTEGRAMNKAVQANVSPTCIQKPPFVILNPSFFGG
jgi:hypothetical protein